MMVSAATETSIGALTGAYRVEGSRVTLPAVHGVMRLHFCQHNMVRVRIVPTGSDFSADNAALQGVCRFDTDYDPVKITVSENGNTLTIASDVLQLAVNKNTLSIAFYNAQGQLISQNTQTNPTGFSGEQGKWVSFQRDAAGTEENFFGLGASRSPFVTTNWRNQVCSLWLDAEGVHTIVPLYYSTAGYGVFLNNTNKGTIAFRSGRYRIDVEGGELDYYWIYGPSFQSIQRDFSNLCGNIAMPPLSALGLTYRGASNLSDDQIEQMIQSLYDRGVAVDTIGIEPGWQTATYPCSYVWSSRFSNPAAFVKRMHAMGLAVNLWEHPYVASVSPIAKAITPYSLASRDLKTETDTKNYAFGGLLPDFTLPEACELYWSIHRDNLAAIGVDGFKVDETDSWGCSDSLDITLPGGMTANAYHNRLGTLAVNLLADRYKQEYNRRIFCYSRGNTTGAQRYATVAYSDTYDFSRYLMTMIADSYSGTYFSPEIRDHDTKSDGEYMRRAQMMFLSAFAMNNEWQDGRTVLDRSETVIDNYLKYNRLYYTLIPYKYSLFWQQHLQGRSVIRSLVMDFQNDTETYKNNNQYLLGDYLMVCPVPGDKDSVVRPLYLPAGCRWIDYETGTVYEGGQTVRYRCEVDTTPLFVRQGAILPCAVYGCNTADRQDLTLTYRLYPEQKLSSFTLYEDDGISYDYEQGVYATTELTLQQTGSGVTFTAADRCGRYAVAERPCVAAFHRQSIPAAVTINSQEIPRAASASAAQESNGPCWYYDSTIQTDPVVAVCYTDKGDSLEIKLWDDRPPVITGLALKTAPQKAQYQQGETLQTQGLCLQAAYANGSLADVTAGYTLTGYDAFRLGRQTVTVSYGGHTTTFTVTVVNAMGDVDGNGTVNAVDALLALRHAVGKTALTDAQIAAADMNEDRVVDAKDALRILKTAVKKA